MLSKTITFVIMIYRLLILTLVCVSISHPAHAQGNKYSLSKCASTYYGASEDKPHEQKLAELRACVVGKQFPAFSATTIAGKKYSDADLKGKVVLVTSWFATCPACKTGMPLWDELHKKYKDKEFLLLSFSADDVEHINMYLKEHPIAYEIFPGADPLIMFEMQTSYGYPTNLIVGKDGQIVEFTTGALADGKELEAARDNYIRIIERELSK